MIDKGPDLANWLSAGATAVAAIVALVIPFIMDSLVSRRGTAAEKRALKEICHSVDRVVLHYLQVRDMVVAANALQQCTRFQQISVESAALAEALDRMLTRPNLTDGPLVAGSAAINLARGVSVAARTAGDQKPDNAEASLKPYHHVAQLAFSRSERVREYHGLPRRSDEKKPVF
ncbi:MAG: hypothetical protein ABI810_08330 [Sphingomonas bacterium]